MAKHLKKNLINKNDGFIVQIIYLLFYYLERISIFYWIRKVFGKSKNSFVRTYIFPEIWAVSNLFFCLLSMKIISLRVSDSISILLLVYALIRVVELFVYQINVLFFHRLNQYYWVDDNVNAKLMKNKNEKESHEEYVIKSATRTLLLLIFNVVEYILQFSVMYMAVLSVFKIGEVQFTVIDSFKMFMNAGDFEILQSANKGQAFMMRLIYFETIIGIFMNILCIARFIGEIPAARQIDK